MKVYADFADEEVAVDWLEEMITMLFVPAVALRWSRLRKKPNSGFAVRHWDWTASCQLTCCVPPKASFWFRSGWVDWSTASISETV